LIDAIKRRRWRELSYVTERSRALCYIAEKMSAKPATMTLHDWQLLRELRFDDQMLLEVAHVVGIFNCLTRLADGFGLHIDAAIEEAGRTGVPLKRRN
jgi:alkylhydroperoxidase family enzyme